MSVFTDRKSIRKYDKNHQIPDDILNKILKEAFRAPTSMNMQPNRVVVVRSKKEKEKLKDVLYGNQIQLETSSAFIIIFSDLEKFDMAPKIFNMAYENGLMPKEVRDRQIANALIHKEKFTSDHLKRDAYIDGGLLAMQLMLVAKSYGYDTCPIGGFNHQTINDALDIDKKLLPVLIVSIGKKDEEGFNSLRLDIEDTVIYK